MSKDQNSWPLWPQYVICYAALALVALLGVVLLQAMTLAISQIGLFLGFNRYAMTTINQFSILFLGIFWLIGILAVEAYLRFGVRDNKLWPRIGKVLAWEIGLLVLTFALQYLPAA